MSQESRKCLVKQSDMSEEMQQTVCDIAIAGFVCYVYWSNQSFYFRGYFNRLISLLYYKY